MGVDAGGLKVPENASGIYQFKITPEVLPWQRGIASEYLLQGVVEVRAAGSVGSVTVMTAGGRIFFGRGEQIPLSVLVRAPSGTKAVSLVLQVCRANQVIFNLAHDLAPGEREWHPNITANWIPGSYQIKVVAPGLSCAGQNLNIGPGTFDKIFQTLLYGDYGGLLPETRDLDSSDLVAANVERMHRLGFDMVVDRLGDSTTTGGMHWYNGAFASLVPFSARLKADGIAFDPRKLESQIPIQQNIAGYGANGIYEMGILMRNDAGLPVEKGVPYDGRSLQECIDDLKEVSGVMAGLPAFRGWSWSSNWWVNKRDADTARNPQERAEYEQAMARTDATGQWSPILDTLGDLRLSYAVAAQAAFNQTLASINPSLVTASACPFRNVQAYPPVSLSNVQETDLQAQWEQIAVPDHAPMNVDFYKRPGKRAWGHPEVYNDDGGGGQILSTLFEMAASGADGVGQSGKVPVWSSSDRVLDDPRTGFVGTASIWRAANPVFEAYGPWIATMEKSDEVAIVASGRMFKIDRWKYQTGTHFARVFEAYIACLHAHRPASIVFAEDMKANSLDRYKAVLLIDQRVEMEQPLSEALHHAMSAGVSIFSDGNCRAEVVKEFKALGFSFDALENDNALAGDDSAYWRFRDYARLHREKLMEALKPITNSDGDCDNDQLLTRERVSGQGRYLFAVNDTKPDLDPGYLWRTNLAVTSRVPVKENVQLDARGGVVYEIMAGKQVQVASGAVDVDCLTLPARIFAILPRAIDHVSIKAPDNVQAGESISWELQVSDSQGAVPASVPVRVRLLGSGGQVLEERFLPALSGIASGSIVAPLNAPGGKVVVEGTELITGKKSSVAVVVNASVPDDAAVSASPADADIAPESRFGPHVRDLVISADSNLAVMNTVNWDNNLYAVDLNTGQTRWRQKVADYFAFSPRVFGDGVCAEGFDFRSAEGYQLSVLNPAGAEQRRFALYGVPGRMSARFVPGIVMDHVDNFAVSKDGAWVASAGNLGLAVWAADGKLLWRQDWSHGPRREARLDALNHQTLLVTEGVTCTAYDATTGVQAWQNILAPTGTVRCVRCTSDGKTCGVLTDVDGGTLFILREGKTVSTIPTGGEDFAISGDGMTIAVVRANMLKLYQVEKGLQWTLSGDDLLHQPRMSADGSRISVGSELGTLYVVSTSGQVLLQRDMRALPVASWMPDGDLVVATWMGKVCRLDGTFGEKWNVLLSPDAGDMRGKLLADDTTPISRIDDWASASSAPVDLSQNLLTKTNAVIKLVPSNDGISGQFTHDPHLLIDGKGVVQSDPWLPWLYIGWFAEISPANWIVIDTMRTQLRVKAITLVEDPAHPESWLRDCALEYWDISAGQWKPAVTMLSDSAVHTHTLPMPVEASRFRLVLPKYLVGNIRLAQISLEGEIIGSTNPDVLAKKPVARLYDGDFNFADSTMLRVKDDQVYNVKVEQIGDTYAGGHMLAIPADGSLIPRWNPTFGEDFPNWDFPITETPQPGEYRYLQFACKGSPQTTGVTVRVTGAGNGANFYLSVDGYAGTEAPAAAPINGQKVAEAVPSQWTVYQVDLWPLFKQNVRIRNIKLYAIGGPAEFDQILLGKSLEDLPVQKK